MSLISLEGALRTCKVDTGWASRIQSDRFENPALMVCPVWNGRDLAGRPVCPDSFVTKTAGCNSAVDRVDVENTVTRPQYVEYLGLDAAGINGDIYQKAYQEAYGNNMLTQQAEQQERFIEQYVPKLSGHFNNQPSAATNVTTCGVYGTKGQNPTYHYPYVVGQAQQAATSRQVQALQRHGENYENYQRCGGY